MTIEDTIEALRINGWTANYHHNGTHHCVDVKKGDVERELISVDDKEILRQMNDLLSQGRDRPK